jgi:primosomal protein N' (replication factor Y)
MPPIRLEHKYVVFLVCVVGIFITVFDTSSSIVALPTIAHEFGTELPTAQWVIVGNGLTIAALLVPMGHLADLIGRKRVYVVGALIFALGALLASWAATIYGLIGARVFVGIGSAMTQTTAMAILVGSFEARERAKMLGLQLGAVGLGAIAGPATGGIVVGTAGWRMLFSITAISMLVIAIIAQRTLRRRVKRPKSEQPPFDYLGALLFATFLVGLLLTLTLGPSFGWLAPATLSGAIRALASAEPGEVFLLHGVTGSGKTLVYIELLRHIVTEQGRSAIVLVPEIALTPQTVDRFRAAFGNQVAVLHSALSDGERLDAWRAIRSGERRIVVGARSAVFAPVANLGAIIVDEEHEASYKQGETPRYHARDVAVMRAGKEGGIAVLGSATPSIESWSNAQRGAYRLLVLPDRVGGGALPKVLVVDMRVSSPTIAVDPFRRVFSEPLERAMRDTLARREQTILLLNRRGFAAFIQCGACGNVVVCPNCSISLTVHRTPERLTCHYCGHAEPIPGSCAKCSGPTIRERGLGTQQVEQLLIDHLPNARVARMDVDTTSARWAHADILDRVARREVDILLGTQMIAKGLDFPNVTLVGVIDADVGMSLPDFRSAERAFQLMAQVAGRAGRGPKGGLVFIQTRLPGHHAVRAAVEHDYRSFVSQEIHDREFPPYPPTVRLANIVVSGTDQAETAASAERATEFLRALIDQRGVEGVHVIGPAPCPIERIKSRWRWHLLVRSRRSSEMSRVLQYFATHFAPEGKSSAHMRLVLDRDPVTLL